MDATNLEKARDFLRGVATADPDLATRHVDPDSFTDHGRLADDGAIDLWKRVATLPASPNVRIVRTVEDGPLLMVQHTEPDHGRTATFEVFRFEHGLIVEHWAFTAPDSVPNRSGHTQADGRATAGHREDTETNKAIVLEYYETVHLAGRHDEARRWFPDGIMIRHEAGVADGGEAFLRDLAVLTRDRTIDAISLLAGEGDLVFLVAQGTYRGEPCAYVDLYRVANGNIVEHWGFPERM
jgi:predicted SnoaL-like aldol condensation-catalyzing enzyme